MKKIAFYLPQFHAIPENDEWWGEGFTEWNNVKKAQPQFKGHMQPEIPINDDYYCLLDNKVQEEQSRLALKYGLDGFCYYHYWFEGKLLLEKPMENMLDNKNIKIPFCICWANETWARTWDGQESNVLIKQNYNEDRRAWKKHFEYFLKFFLDDRYIRDGDKPLLLIYKPYLIKQCKEMLAYWRELAIEAGLTGLYIGFQHHSCFDYNMSDFGFDFGIEFEPFYSVREFKNDTKSLLNKSKYAIKSPSWLVNKVKEKIANKPVVYDYDYIWEKILLREPEAKNIFPGAFPSWDNTPRRGNNANVFFEATPEKFKKYFEMQILHAKETYNAKYIFINAWNEWAEGAHLEPDKYNNYGYLEAILESETTENDI